MNVSVGVVREWWKMYRARAGAPSIASAAGLQEQYGASISNLAKEYNTAFKLCQQLLKRDPPLYVTDGIAKEWLKKYGPHGALKYVDNAGHLESLYGDVIREDTQAKSLDAESLCKWLLNEHSVSAIKRTCQKWRETDWSSSPVLMSLTAVEESTRKT